MNWLGCEYRYRLEPGFPPAKVSDRKVFLYRDPIHRSWDDHLQKENYNMELTLTRNEKKTPRHLKPVFDGIPVIHLQHFLFAASFCWRTY